MKETIEIKIGHVYKIKIDTQAKVEVSLIIISRNRIMAKVIFLIEKNIQLIELGEVEEEEEVIEVAEVTIIIIRIRKIIMVKISFTEKVEAKEILVAKKEERVNRIVEEDRMNGIVEEEIINRIVEEDRMNGIVEEDRMNGIVEEERVNRIVEEEAKTTNKAKLKEPV